MANYSIILRARSGVYFKAGQHMTLEEVPTDRGRITVRFFTRRATRPGFTRAVALGLCAEATGAETGMDAALNAFTYGANTALPVISLVCNAPTEHLIPEFAFDTTPELSEREFFQNQLPDEEILPFRRREVPVAILQRVFTAIAAHPDADRIQRATAFYHHALQGLEPGTNIVAANSLWIAMENLTPVALRTNPETAGVPRETLAARWSVEPRAVDAEARRRLLFRCDPVYNEAKAASDAMEHGFRALSDVHVLTAASQRRTAQLVREAIFSLLRLSADDVTHLESRAYASPLHLMGTRHFRGRIVANGRALSSLAPPGQGFPSLDWKTTYAEVPNDKPDEIRFTVNHNIRPLLAEGVELKCGSIRELGSDEDPRSV